MLTREQQELNKKLEKDLISLFSSIQVTFHPETIQLYITRDQDEEKLREIKLFFSKFSGNFDENDQKEALSNVKHIYNPGDIQNMAIELNRFIYIDDTEKFRFFVAEQVRDKTIESKYNSVETVTKAFESSIKPIPSRNVENVAHEEAKGFDFQRVAESISTTLKDYKSSREHKAEWKEPIVNGDSIKFEKEISSGKGSFEVRKGAVTSTDTDEEVFAAMLIAAKISNPFSMLVIQAPSSCKDKWDKVCAEQKVKCAFISEETKVKSTCPLDPMPAKKQEAKQENNLAVAKKENVQDSQQDGPPTLGR
jgi:hypothetical protein